MEENKLIPFPQADDFSKVILLINFPKEKLKDNEYIKTNLGNITERQVSYYVSAAQYLNIIDSKRVEGKNVEIPTSKFNNEVRVARKEKFNADFPKLNRADFSSDEEYKKAMQDQYVAMKKEQWRWQMNFQKSFLFRSFIK